MVVSNDLVLVNLADFQTGNRGITIGGQSIRVDRLVSGEDARLEFPGIASLNTEINVVVFYAYCVVLREGGVDRRIGSRIPSNDRIESIGIFDLVAFNPDIGIVEDRSSSIGNDLITIEISAHIISVVPGTDAVGELLIRDIGNTYLILVIVRTILFIGIDRFPFGVGDAAIGTDFDHVCFDTAAILTITCSIPVDVAFDSALLADLIIGGNAGDFGNSGVRGKDRSFIIAVARLTQDSEALSLDRLQALITFIVNCVNLPGNISDFRERNSGRFRIRILGFCCSYTIVTNDVTYNFIFDNIAVRTGKDLIPGENCAVFHSSGEVSGIHAAVDHTRSCRGGIEPVIDISGNGLFPVEFVGDNRIRIGTGNHKSIALTGFQIGVGVDH